MIHQKLVSLGTQRGILGEKHYICLCYFFYFEFTRKYPYFSLFEQCFKWAFIISYFIYSIELQGNGLFKQKKLRGNARPPPRLSVLPLIS